MSREDGHGRLWGRREIELTNDLISHVFGMTDGLSDVPLPHRREDRETDNEAGKDESHDATRQQAGVISEVECIHAADLGEHRRHFSEALVEAMTYPPAGGHKTRAPSPDPPWKRPPAAW